MTTYGNGCDGQDGTLSDGGLVATFNSQTPTTGSFAQWQAAVPPGTTLTSVALDRATVGFPAQPGDLLYTSSTSTSLLESSSVSLGGVVSFTTGPADEAQFAVRCDAAPQTACPAPTGTSAAPGVQVSSMALGVNDPDPPIVAVGGVLGVVTGSLQLTISATDDGLGLESATVYVDGQPTETVYFGGLSCAPIGESGGTIELPLGADCPSVVSDQPVTVSTADLPDGPHQLMVTVTDAAGNTTTAVDETLTVRNHPPIAPSSVIIALGNGNPSQSGGGGGSGGSGKGGVGGSRSTKPSACPSPRLAVALASTPERISRHDVAVLWRRGRYLFDGRLTCLLRGRRVSAPNKSIIDVYAFRPRHVYLRGTHTSTSVYRDGRFKIDLRAATTRVFEFAYGSARNKSIVWIAVIATSHPPRRPAPRRTSGRGRR